MFFGVGASASAGLVGYGSPQRGAPPPTEVAPPAASAAPADATPPAPAAAAPDWDEPAKPEPGARVQWKSDETPPEAAPVDESTDEPEATAGVPDSWELGGGHFILSFERMTTLLSWKQSFQATNPNDGSIAEISTSGTDVSLLWGGGERTPSSLPRLAFDGVFDNGLTLGGSLGFMSSTGKNKELVGEVSLPDLSGYLFGVRAGAMLLATETLGIWLRGGFTHFSATAAASSDLSTPKTVITAWDFTLDPQLVFVAAPRVGITLGPLLDIPLGGTDRVESGGQVREVDYKSSAYGVTAGASAIF